VPDIIDSDGIDQFEFPDLQSDSRFEDTVGVQLKAYGPNPDKSLAKAASESPHASAAIDLLHLNSLEFLHKLSTINFTNKLSDETLDEGNSRDPPWPSR
jgi:hypothetical protein